MIAKRRRAAPETVQPLRQGAGTGPGIERDGSRGKIEDGTLTEISQRLNGAHQTLRSITDTPALKLTPESLARRMDDAARKARRTEDVWTEENSG